MKKRCSSGLFLSKAVEGFHKYKVVEGLSPRTLKGYATKLALLVEHLGDPPLPQVTAADIEDFLFWLRADYRAERLNGKTAAVCDKTVYNYWVALKSFFGWVKRRGFRDDNPMQDVPRPKYQIRPMDALTKDEVKALIGSVRYRREVDSPGRESYRMQRRTYRRDRAIILALLDTGARASELCSMRVGDVDMQTGEIHIRHCEAGGAKGRKGRSVYIGKRTRRALWRYLVERDDGEIEDAPLFATQDGQQMNKDALRLLLVRLGERAGLEKCHPHMFRHTFAINYLRGGGDVLTLQALLGHSNLEMVRRYARIAKIDLQRQYGKASPVDTWSI